MALTKVTLTGAINNIKEAWTKFNDLIDDLLSTSNGLGASCVGIEDSAGNMDAVNVETALAEIYTDHSSTRTLAEIFDENSATTTGLTWGYKAGAIRASSTVTSVATGTISLTDDATNYVEVNSAGTVSRNTTSFTSGKIPLRQITTASGVQTVSTDKRAWFMTSNVAGTTSQKGIVELATDAEGVTGTSDVVVMTPGTCTAQLAEPPEIGGTTPAAGTFTVLSVTTGVVGFMATDAEAVAGTSDAVAMTPGTCTAQLAEPPTIGGTTPGQGNFSSIPKPGTIGGTTPAAITGTTIATSGANDMTIANGNLVIGTAGKGIDFSATADGTTMLSELLDDYEEGEFTVTTVSAGGSLSIGSHNTMSYTKIGRMVFINGQLNIGAESSPSGDLTINGMPFAVGAGTDAAENATISVSLENLKSAIATYADAQIATTALTIRERGLTTQGNDISNHFDTGSAFRISGFYYTDL